MGDLKVNVSYSRLKQELSGLSHGISKMTDGYLKEIAEVGRERLKEAYGPEYDSFADYDGIIPSPSVTIEKTKQNSYVVRVSEDAALLEYGTGLWSENYEWPLPPGWAEHTPDAAPGNSGKKDYWYFEIPKGLQENPAWDHYKYFRQVGRPPRPKKTLGAGNTNADDYFVDKNDPLFQAWAEYDAWRADPTYELVTSPTWGVAYGHEPANGIPKAWDAMLEKAEESAKKFYLKKYK